MTDTNTDNPEPGGPLDPNALPRLLRKRKVSVMKKTTRKTGAPMNPGRPPTKPPTKPGTKKR